MALRKLIIIWGAHWAHKKAKSRGAPRVYADLNKAELPSSDNNPLDNGKDRERRRSKR